jgi:hypothetical protein
MAQEITLILPDHLACTICGKPKNPWHMVHVAHGDTAKLERASYWGVSLCVSCWHKTDIAKSMGSQHADANAARYRKPGEPQSDVELAIDGSPL